MTTVNRGPPTPNMPKGPLFLRYATASTFHRAPDHRQIFNQ